MADKGAEQEPAGSAARGQPVRVATVATGGIEFAVTILLGVFAGQWLDRRMGTAPWLVILGVLLGAAVGFYNLYRTLTTAQHRGSSRARGTTNSDGGKAGNGGET
jgi:ATP synthase protein I